MGINDIFSTETARPEMTKNLYIFSYGLKFSHITRETLEVFKKCGVVYSPVLDSKSAERFSAKFPDLGRKLKLIELDRRKGMEKTVLDGFKTHDTVGFLTFGNPAFLNGNLHGLARAAESKKITVTFLEAVSSLDALINLFKLNLENELRLIDVSRLNKDTVLTPGANTMFFSLNRLNAPGEAARKRMFLAKVAKAYAPGAAVHLAACCTGEAGGSSLLTGKAGGLAALLAGAGANQTLFIPANSRLRAGRGGR
jgi:hypothetical protein